VIKGLTSTFPLVTGEIARGQSPGPHLNDPFIVTSFPVNNQIGITIFGGPLPIYYILAQRSEL
jgi:hypothetical protein